MTDVQTMTLEQIEALSEEEASELLEEVLDKFTDRDLRMYVIQHHHTFKVLDQILMKFNDRLVTLETILGVLLRASADQVRVADGQTPLGPVVSDVPEVRHGGYL